MGKKAPTVGFRYFLGLVFALCQGPIDRVQEILIAERLAWRASAGGSGANAPDPDTDLLATVDAMTATAGGGDANFATITFPGRVNGVGVDQVIDLTLADGTAVTATTALISYDADADVTTWLVTPRTLAFAAQTVEVRLRPQPGAPSASGGTAGDGTDGTGGRFRIDKPDLFGGDGREGGIVGDADIAMGGPDQIANDYLAAVIERDTPGRPVPAYRGVASVILRQMYLGNNPYIKKWAFRVTRVLAAEDGAEQWYPETAPIFVADGETGEASDPFFVGLSRNNTIDARRLFVPPSQVGSLTRATAAPDFDDSSWEIIRMPIGGFTPTIEPFGVMPGPQSLKITGGAEWVRIRIPPSDRPVTIGLATGMQTAAQLFVDGEEVAFGFNVGAPQPRAETRTIPASDSERVVAAIALFSRGGLLLAASLYFHVWFDQGTQAGEPDMNPAHIIRELLTNRDFGRGIPEADIGDSFRTAADTLFAEGLGLSFQWERESSVEEFIGDILRHIDATLYQDRRTGLIELKLIRPDYAIEDLPVFDDRHVLDWSDLARRDVGDLVDTVTVKFSDRRTDKTGAITATDIARRQFAGAGRNAVAPEFKGVRWESLAARIAARELRSLSAQLFSGPVRINRLADTLNPGDPFILRSVRHGVDGVFRVVDLDLGDGRENSILVKAVEDVFALGAGAPVGGPRPSATPLGDEPLPTTRRLVQEAPYWAAVQSVGHDAADAALAGDPDTGRILAAGARRTQSTLEIEIWTRTGANFAGDGNTGFSPFAELAADVTRDPAERQLAVGDWVDLARVRTGAMLAVGGELMRVDGVGETSIDVGRGVLDTVPAAHGAGAQVAIWSDDFGLSEAEIGLGDQVAVRLRPRTPRGLLALGRAPEDVVTMNSRAIRPLPPGALAVDGSFAPPPEALAAAPVTLTWAHRDRLSQTSASIDDYLAGDIGPEPGVSYELQARWIDLDGTATEPPAFTADLGTATSHVLAMADLPVGAAPAGVTLVEITVRSRRTVGGTVYFDWQYRGYAFQIAASGIGYGRRYGVAHGL